MVAADLRLEQATLREDHIWDKYGVVPKNGSSSNHLNRERGVTVGLKLNCSNQHDSFWLIQIPFLVWYWHPKSCACLHSWGAFPPVFSLLVLVC